MTATALPPARIHAWDRAAITLLGGAGCALSYDALQQMATAIHVRGPLTYLFPLVIDGFIAYGVRALLILRTASFRARLYVWTLFGTATTASIWANALHAVRLNQQLTTRTGLRLGDTTVGILSTLAPLALAGAVHLYILIARHPAQTTDPGRLGPLADTGHRTYRTKIDRPDNPTQPTTVSAGQVTFGPSPSVQTGSPTQSDDRTPVTPADGRDTRSPDQGTDQAQSPVRPGPVTGPQSERPAMAGQPDNPPVTHPVAGDRGDRGSDPVTERLLPIARQAVTQAGQVTRAVVAQAIRGQGIPLSNDRLTVLMQQLRTSPE